ncbi:MAG: glycosyltransferase [Thermofilum sp.]
MSGLFIAWRRLSRRTELLAELLGMKVAFFRDSLPYLRAMARTAQLLRRSTARNVWIQLPQGPLLAEAAILKRVYGFRLVADVHSGFLVHDDWKSFILNAPFKKLLERCDAVVVHNKQVLELLPHGWEDRVLVVYDPWPLLEQRLRSRYAWKCPEGEEYLVMPASFAPDEPVEQVVRAFNRIKGDTKLLITGNWKRRPRLKRYESSRVKFTGFLPDDEYYRLLACARGIIAATTREYTALMAAWEAVALAKPLAVSSTKTLRELFSGYALFFLNDEESISETMEMLLRVRVNEAAREELRKRTERSLEEARKLTGSLAG